MTQKTPEKKRARALQKRTNWSYVRCLQCVTTMSLAEVEALAVVEERKGAEETARIQETLGSFLKDKP